MVFILRSEVWTSSFQFLGTVLGVVEDEGGVGEPGMAAFSVSGNDFVTHLARCVLMKRLRRVLKLGRN